MFILQTSFCENSIRKLTPRKRICTSYDVDPAVIQNSNLLGWRFNFGKNAQVPSARQDYLYSVKGSHGHSKRRCSCETLCTSHLVFAIPIPQLPLGLLFL